MPYIITDPAEQDWAREPETASHCCGKPPMPDTLEMSKYGITGMCSRCREWVTFDNTCAECGRPLSDGEEEKCSHCSFIAYTGGV